MNTISRVSLGGMAAVAAVVTVGIGSASAAPNYDTLPVNPNVITDSTAYIPVPPVADPDGRQGVRQEFNHRDGSRGITTTILVLPSRAGGDRHDERLARRGWAPSSPIRRADRSRSAPGVRGSPGCRRTARSPSES